MLLRLAIFSWRRWMLVLSRGPGAGGSAGETGPAEDGPGEAEPARPGEDAAEGDVGDTSKLQRDEPAEDWELSGCGGGGGGGGPAAAAPARPPLRGRLPALGAAAWGAAPRSSWGGPVPSAAPAGLRESRRRPQPPASPCSSFTFTGAVVAQGWSPPPNTGLRSSASESGLWGPRRPDTAAPLLCSGSVSLSCVPSTSISRRIRDLPGHNHRGSVTTNHHTLKSISSHKNATASLEMEKPTLLTFKTLFGGKSLPPEH